MSVSRVARRVSEGGHNVPEGDVRRRFQRGITRLPDYIPRVDLWRVFDANSVKPFVAAEGRRGCAGMRNSLTGLPPDLRRLVEGLPECAEV